jgi:hypothetical protein
VEPPEPILTVNTPDSDSEVSIDKITSMRSTRGIEETPRRRIGWVLGPY